MSSNTTNSRDTSKAGAIPNNLAVLVLYRLKTAHDHESRGYASLQQVLSLAVNSQHIPPEHQWIFHIRLANLKTIHRAEIDGWHRLLMALHHQISSFPALVRQAACGTVGAPTFTDMQYQVPTGELDLAGRTIRLWVEQVWGSMRSSRRFRASGERRRR